jgi:hypothetical protein
MSFSEARSRSERPEAFRFEPLRALPKLAPSLLQRNEECPH